MELAREEGKKKTKETAQGCSEGEGLERRDGGSKGSSKKKKQEKTKKPFSVLLV